jgi:hypothetical protein
MMMMSAVQRELRQREGEEKERKERHERRERERVRERDEEGRERREREREEYTLPHSITATPSSRSGRRRMNATMVKMMQPARQAAECALFSHTGPGCYIQDPVDDRTRVEKHSGLWTRVHRPNTQVVPGTRWTQRRNPARSDPVLLPARAGG